MNTPEAALELCRIECLDAPEVLKASLQLLFGAETLSLLSDGKGG